MKSKKAFIEFIKNKSDFTIEIISQTDDWIVFKCKAKVNKPWCGTGGGTGGNKRMTLNKLAEIVLNLSNTVETGFAEIRQDIKTIKEDVAVLKKDVSILKQDVTDIKVRVCNLEKDVAVLKEDVSGIKKCPTIQKELSELAD